MSEAMQTGQPGEQAQFEQSTPVSIEQMFLALGHGVQQLTNAQRQQAETQRKTTELLQMLLEQQVGSKQGRGPTPAGTIPADEAKMHRMPTFSGLPMHINTASAAEAKKIQKQLVVTLHQFLQEAELWMSTRPTDPGHTTARLVMMLKDQAGAWFRSQVQVPGQPLPAYEELKKLLIGRYVHREMQHELRMELQNFRWTGRGTMRQHCEQFHEMANRLVVFMQITPEERWRWFKDSLATCAQVHTPMILMGLHEKETVTADEFTSYTNKICHMVDGVSFGGSGAAPVAASGSGPTPMDIDQLAVQLQQLRAEPEARSLLLAALGADDRGRGYERDHANRPRGGGWRDGTPDRVRQARDSGGWRARGQDGGGGWRGRAFDRGGGGGWHSSRSPSPGLSISELKKHSMWPRWAMDWTQDRIDRATRAGQCFLCRRERHEGGWLNCPNLARSRTPSPVRERWGRPNGGGAPRQGR